MALSVGLPRPGVTRHRFLLESGLSSPLPEDNKAAIQPSAQEGQYAQRGPLVNGDIFALLVLKNEISLLQRTSAPRCAA